MAKDCSFDVVSEFDKQELVNAIDQVKRDLTSRFDLKNSNSSVALEADKSITITTNDDMKLRNIYDILQSKLVKLTQLSEQFYLLNGHAQELKKSFVCA